MGTVGEQWVLGMASTERGASRLVANRAPAQPAARPRRICVLVADADPAARVGWAALMMGQYGIHFVGTAQDGLEVVRMVRRHPTDVVFMSLRLPELDALEVAGIIRSIRPKTRLVVCADPGDESQALRALACGVSGFLRRDAPESQILEAIQTAHQGGRCYPAAARSGPQPGHAPARAGTPAPTGASACTDRQKQVLRLLGLGLTDNQIAGALDLTVRTVESHRVNLHARLGLESPAALASFGLGFRP
jgi:DNA-binding NarL/FixJ family response regulator